MEQVFVTRLTNGEEIKLFLLRGAIANQQKVSRIGPHFLNFNTPTSQSTIQIDAGSANPWQGPPFFNTTVYNSHPENYRCDDKKRRKPSRLRKDRILPS
jgi:hypothetical protein